ncbi:hypothetical protein BA065_00515 [Nanoarchaeota archaeon NZ13-N]|nr:MAG: hypothetical protein BA065_00515 [Nanoarchaeota archaeon NZ13-N]
MSTVKDLLKDWRIVLYIIVLFASILYLLYTFLSVRITVDESPILPKGSVVYEINGCKVSSVQSFYSCIPKEGSAIVKTDRGNFILDPTEIELLKYNTSVTVSGNLKLGTDIGGGYLIILKSLEDLSIDQMNLVQRILENRLNSAGLKALNIYTAGRNYIIIQVPSTEKTLIESIMRQGYFEAKIMNQTVFTGIDIINILTGSGYSGMECDNYQGSWVCSYYFTLVLSKDAAKRFAEITKNIPVSIESGGRYLTEKIYFYLDGEEVSDLYIDSNLKGVEANQVLIRVSGQGSSQKLAAEDAINRARELQIVLGSGSLPSKFSIEEISYISPRIASSSLDKIFIAGLIALIILGIVVFLAYRNLKASLLIYIPMLSEIIIAVAIGIFLGQTFDIPAILGVFLGIATGMDDNLIIVNDAIRGKKEYKIEKSRKKVLFIVLTAVMTEIFAFVPMLLSNVALGLFRGFAVMTIITSLVGYAITRPAYVKLTFALL